MIETLSQYEAEPATYPTIPDLASDDAAMIWQRIEFYTAYRFSERQVTWRVNSDGGEWSPPLRPVSDLAATIWNGTAYEAVTLSASPGGWCLPHGQYEITASVGAAPVPAAVATAAKRLADYMMAESLTPAGARSYSTNGGQLSESFTMDLTAKARALQNSGAADLLRPYRKA